MLPGARPSRRGVGRAAVLLVLGGLLLSTPGVAPSATHAAADPTVSAVPIPPVDVTAGSSAPVLSPPSSSLSGPFHGHYYARSAFGPDGVSNFGTSIVADPSSAVAFVASALAGPVTAFSVANGTVLARAQAADYLAGECACSLGLDTNHRQLFVGVTVSGGAGPRPGWVLVLNETDLALVRNLSIPSSPFPPFEPTQMAFDPGSDQMFVENATAGEIVALNATTLSVNAWLLCPLTSCRNEGLAVAEGRAALLVPTGSRSLAVYHTSTDAFETALVAPPGLATLAVVYDPGNATVFDLAVSNASNRASVLRFDLANFTYLGAWTNGPVAPGPLVYDPGTDALVVTDTNASTEITAFSAATGARLGFFNSSTASPARRFGSIALVPSLGEVVTAGSYDNSTIAFALPTLGVVMRYPSFATEQLFSTVDPALRELLVLGVDPTAVTAFAEGNGTVLWTRYLSEASPNGLAVDPSIGKVYVSNLSDGLQTLNASSGALGGVVLAGGAIRAIAVDPVHHLAYLGEPGEAQVVSTSSDALVGTVPLPGVVSCQVVVDPNLAQAYFPNCGDPGNITTVTGIPAVRGHVYPTPPVPTEGAIAPNGEAYFVVGNASTGLVALDPATNSTSGIVNLAPTQVAEVRIDPSANLLFASSIANGTVKVLDLPSDAVLGSLPNASGTFRMEFDNGTGTLLAVSLVRGEFLEFTRVEAPRAPAPVDVSIGNGTLEASWTAPPGGITPIVGYNVSIATNWSGPWTRTTPTTRTNASYSGLADGTTYYVVVSASNVAGAGPPSTPVGATPAGVPYPPVSVSLWNGTNSSFNVSWQPPAFDGGSAVTNYTLLYAVNSSGGSVGLHWARVNVGTALAFRLAGLPSATEITVEVRAWNLVGGGATSAPTSARTLSNPAPTPSSDTGNRLYAAAALIVAAGIVTAATVVLMRRRDPPPPTPPREPAGTPAPPAGGPAAK